MMKKCWIVLLLALSMPACAAKNLRTDDIHEETEQMRFPISSPLAQVVKEHRPPFTIDPTAPFLVMFGRGSGRFGLNTAEINEQGTVGLYRIRSEERDDAWHLFWETGTLQLSPEDLEVVVDSINTFQPTALHKEYHAEVYDGTQWVLWLKQEPHEKSVYCNNHFPESMYEFSDFLDEFLAEHGLENVTWTKVPQEDYRKHEEELWRSIQ
ncbi:MAG: hypothetical protein GY801_06150 [bacterium]|nr:hypothetical protein [bacterium]